MEQADTWRQFCAEHPLHLRAVCNEVADAATRPVAPDVVNRVREHPEAATLYEEVRHASQTPVRPSAVAGQLVKDPRWRTIVLETVKASADAERLQKSLLQRAWGWLTTARPGSTSPTEAAIKIALQGAAATVGVTLVVALANRSPLRVPLLIQLDERQAAMAVDVRLEGTRTIPITVQAPESIAIQLRTDGAAVPVTVLGAESLASLAADMKGASESLSVVAAEVAAGGSRIESAIGRITPVDPAMSTHVQAIGERLAGIERAVGQDRTVRVELGPAAEQLRKAAYSLTALTAVAARGHTLTTFTATEKSTSVGEFEMLDWTGQPTTCEVSLTAGEIGRTLSIQRLAGSCSAKGSEITLAPAALPPLRRGGVVWLKSKDQRIGLSVVVDDIEDTWIGPDSAVLRVVAGTLPEGAPPVQASIPPD